MAQWAHLGRARVPFHLYSSRRFGRHCEAAGGRKRRERRGTVGGSITRLATRRDSTLVHRLAAAEPRHAHAVAAVPTAAKGSRAAAPPAAEAGSAQACRPRKPGKDAETGGAQDNRGLEEEVSPAVSEVQAGQARLREHVRRACRPHPPRVHRGSSTGFARRRASESAGPPSTKCIRLIKRRDPDLTFDWTRILKGGPDPEPPRNAGHVRGVRRSTRRPVQRHERRTGTIRTGRGRARRSATGCGKPCPLRDSKDGASPTGGASPTPTGHGGASHTAAEIGGVGGACPTDTAREPGGES